LVRRVLAGVRATLCQAAIDLAHRFGAIAVAEGIETAAELNPRHRMGCEIGQGYLFAKPMPRDQLVSALVKNATTKAAA
jgi:EAL domain-containing protein (putative c-di-GMP-specific phosphodiesterase class I)